MPQAKAETSSVHSEKLRRSIARTQLTIAAAYAYDSLILFGFYAAGYIGIVVPLSVSAALALLVGAINLAHHSGWSRDCKDPTLFLPQQLYAIAVALAVAMTAPQIAFQPLATLFAISAFAFMAPDLRSQLVGAGIAALGGASVILTTGPYLAMPTSTLAGQALTSAVVFCLLARCIWVAVFFRSLQRRLSEKNKALKAAVQQIDAMANRDELTGLPNRRCIGRLLAEEMALCDKTGLALSVALLDIDHFKRINDAWGHLAGDRTLQIFASVASTAIRTGDRMGRFGGEEFLLVLTATRLRDAEAILNRIRECICYHDWSAIDNDLHVTITVGATEYAKGDSVEELIRRADLALYLGKESGRDRVVLDRKPLQELRPGQSKARVESALAG
ncbi:MAG: GGDEF domain-containing protein [Hyphomicrobiales bacterium]|nr:GGDEF domain-containing protein [Hyphomicrobiales bacterium]